MKNQKGITLIALVITIIVLLILAGISIAMIAGTDGIITKSRQAKADNEIGAAKDAIALVATEAMADYFEQFVTDLNGDGEVNIGLINCSVSADPKDIQYRNYMAM